MKILKYADIFSGISCPAMALKQLGINFSYEFACDIDKTCQKFLSEYHKPKKIFKDVAEIVSLPKVDLLVAGFPCQPFSGIQTYIKTTDHGSRDLYQYCKNVIQLSRPEIFILENVKGLTFKSNKDYFDKMLAELDSLDEYVYEYKVLNSKDYGTPQSRPRIWFIGKRKGSTINWPIRNPVTSPVSSWLEMDLPLNEFTTKKPDRLPLENGWWVNNGQIGNFAMYHAICDERVWLYCLTTKNETFILYRSDDSITKRCLSINELKKAFGVTLDDLPAGYRYGHMFGNGMDVGLLMQLIEKNEIIPI